MKSSNPALLPIERTFGIRLLEIMPGLAAWLFLLSPIYLGLLEPVWLAYIIIAFDLAWLVKSGGLSIRLLRGYGRLHASLKVDWQERLKGLSDIPSSLTQASQRLKVKGLSKAARAELNRYRRLLYRLQQNPDQLLAPQQLTHAVIVALYNESLEIIEPTIKALTQVQYNTKKIWLIIAYEERGGQEAAKTATYLAKEYGHHFAYAEAVVHPGNIPHEVKGKAGNITLAGRRLASLVKKEGLDPEQVVVTTLDCDNRPHANYFSYLSFVYCTTPDRVHCSYQPIPMYYNNIWDVPAPMRVIATGNGFWQLTESMRPYRFHNFSAHAQSLQTLIDTDFWNVRSIVEDGHQFWRTYFTYNGNHRVQPLYTTVYQDAVLAVGYWQTCKAQFKQLQRWAWGINDFSYIVVNNRRYKKIPFGERALQLFRFSEGHFMWATAPLVLALAAWAPLILNINFNDQTLAHQLPVIASRIQTLTSVGVIITIIISLISLPPRPAHYKKRHSIFMVLQWALLPFTTIIFGSFAALNAQTRLMFGRYLDEFAVTVKATAAQQPKRRWLRRK